MSVELKKTTTAPQSGYTPCACRDCMDITVSSDMASPELCSECTDAGCVPWRTDRESMGAWYGATYECQRDDAYEDC